MSAMEYELGHNVLRTPDRYFEDLEDYSFEPNYLEVDGLRLHYVDEGPKDGEVVLMLHGEPSWSYLYRKMIPIIVEAGYRAIAPDLIGFGKSDKLIRQKDYSYTFHVHIIKSFLAQLDLTNITLFCQDWGGLIGIRVAMNEQKRFDRIVASNTSIPFAPSHEDLPMRKMALIMLRTGVGFGSWYVFSQVTPVLDAGFLLDMGSANKLSSEVKRAYNAPFPTKHYKAGFRVFPRLVPSEPDECRVVWEKLQEWDKPFLTVFGDRDPITSVLDKLFQVHVPGAAALNHKKIKKASHFCQEDKGEELAKLTVKFIQTGNI